MAHRIRLRGPWEVEFFGDRSGVANDSASGSSIARARVQMPQGWHSPSWPEGTRRATLARKFHSPTGLTESTRVTLVVLSSLALLSIRLNGESLDGSHSSPTSFFEDGSLGEPRCWEIARRLRATNELFAELEIDAGAVIGQPIWEVWLELTDQ